MKEKKEREEKIGGLQDELARREHDFAELKSRLTRDLSEVRVKYEEDEVRVRRERDDPTVFDLVFNAHGGRKSTLEFGLRQLEADHKEAVWNVNRQLRDLK